MLEGKEKSTHQEANGALFKLRDGGTFIFPRVARSKLGVKNEFPKLLVVHILVLIQSLRPRELLVHHLPPPTQLISHPKISPFFHQNSPPSKSHKKEALPFP